MEKGCGKVPIYALGKVEPTLPDAGRFWLAPDAHIIGNVRLGPDVGIWFGAILRGDTELLVVGEGSNIQEGAMLHADPGFPLTIGRGVTVGHHAILHGCIIGANTLIGMGSTILNGARIGASCLIGANTLITEGKEFPDNSLIFGAPAKIRRTLDKSDDEQLRRSALQYVANWKRFAEELRLVGTGLAL